MHKWTVRAARVALVAAAFTAAGTGIANADHTSGDHSILGGEQIRIPIIAPIGLFGNHVNVLSSGYGGYRFAHVRADNPNPMYQAAPADTQMDICGNAISSANGVGTAACKGQASLGGENAPAPVAPAAMEAPDPAVGAPSTSIGAPGAPVPASAEAPAVAPAIAPAQAPAAAPAVEMSTSGQNGVASGNQTYAPVRTPVRICGNAGALGGMATAACEGTASSGRLSHRAVRSLDVAGLLD